MASYYRNSAPTYDLHYDAIGNAVNKTNEDNSLLGKIASFGSKITRQLGEDLIGPFFQLNNEMKKASTERQQALWQAEQDGIARQDEMAYNAQGKNTTKLIIAVIVVILAILIFKYKKN